MASVRVLPSQTSRHCLIKPPSSPLVAFNRSLSSSNPHQNDESSSPKHTIQIVSYSTKPKDESTHPVQKEKQQGQQQQLQSQTKRSRRDFPTREARIAWTWENIWYVKDAPSIPLELYPTRLAPLPEDSGS